MRYTVSVGAGRRPEASRVGGIHTVSDSPTGTARRRGLRPPPATRDELIAIAQRLLDATAEPVDSDGTQLVVAISAGVAYAEHAMGCTADRLLRDADDALYRAKCAGKRDIELSVIDALPVQQSE